MGKLSKRYLFVTEGLSGQSGGFLVKHVSGQSRIDESEDFCIGYGNTWEVGYTETSPRRKQNSNLTVTLQLSSATSPHPSSHLALSPLDVERVGESRALLDSGNGAAVRSRQGGKRHLGVDVEERLAVARGPDGQRDLVVLVVPARHGPGKARSGRNLHQC